MRRTKIVATIGPASDSPEQIEKLILAGMNVARLNFSHGSHEEHARRIALIRETASRLGRPVAILQDLQGPKIRTGTLVDGKPVLLRPGERFTITTQELVGTAEKVSTTYKALPGDVRPGDRILLSDGLIELRVISSTADEVETEVVYGGDLRQKQGINLPGVQVSAPAVTEKDAIDLVFGLEQDVDYVAISFVRRAADVADVKERISKAGKATPVIAKIEKPEALTEIDGILDACDGIMVARGDLGVEVPAEQVPITQKMLISAANACGKPVITATQMLESMIYNPRPTRAEASDVANAILDGTDAVMLSGETANGVFPIEAVQTMARIAEAAEVSYDLYHASMDMGNKSDVRNMRDFANSISSASAAIVNSLDVRYIVAFTLSGSTARLVSRQRPRVPILAFTPAEDVYRRMALIWGVIPVISPFMDRLDDLSEYVTTRLFNANLAVPGDLVVMTGGHPLQARGATNFVKVMELTEGGPRASSED